MLDRMNQDIMRSALQKELKDAECDLRQAFSDVGRMVKFDPSQPTQRPGYENPRSVVDCAIQKLQKAASYYDAVQEALLHLPAATPTTEPSNG